jgi:hypothetical protein
MKISGQRTQRFIYLRFVFFVQIGKAFIVCQLVSEFPQPAKPAAEP